LQFLQINLISSPSTVTLKKIFLLISPKEFTSGKEAKERALNNKKRSLEIAETLGLDEEEEQKKK